jgi:Flp pilus assembly protein TadG
MAQVQKSATPAARKSSRKSASTPTDSQANTQVAPSPTPQAANTNPQSNLPTNLHADCNAKWIQVFGVVAYASVGIGDAVEVTNSKGEVATVVVAHVLASGISAAGKNAGLPWTKFIPVPKLREESKVRAISPSRKAAESVAELRGEMNQFMAMMSKMVEGLSHK